eukprot:c42723_g1_i1 orf=3-170(-)
MSIYLKSPRHHTRKQHDRNCSSKVAQESHSTSGCIMIIGLYPQDKSYNVQLTKAEP